MGKLGSGAMNYASDLDLVFAYDPAVFGDPAAQLFYTRVTRRVREQLGQSGERGKLYDIDLRLRPRGGASTLAVTLDELQKYLQTEAGYWERIAATRARVLDVSTDTGRRAQAILDEFVYTAPADVQAARDMRARLEAAPGDDLKRGRGGTLDIEFLVAHLQMRHRVSQPRLWEALDELHAMGAVDGADHAAITGTYAYLRHVVNRMQILDGVSRHELPQAEAFEIFARRMGYKAGGGLEAAQQLKEELDWHRAVARRMYEKHVQ
jgi:glutamate-ammonia-ligase adenylyltransferase